MGFLSGLKRYFNIQNQCNSPYQQVNKKDNMLISIDTEKAFLKIYYTFLIRACRKLEIEGYVFILIKDIYEKSTANIRINGKD